MAAGSWLGLPELGISEKLGGNKNSIYKTSANPGGYIARPASDLILGSRDVPGASTGPSNMYDQPIGPDASLAGPAPTQGGGNAGGSGGSNNDSDFIKQLDNLYKERLGFLDSQASGLQSQQGTAIKEVQDMVGLGRQRLDQSSQQAETGFNQQIEQGAMRKEDAMSSAVRLYNELMRGGQQRFGGASSAGEAYQTLGAQELQRNAGEINQGFEGFVQQVETARTNARQQYETARRELDFEESRLINDVNRQFREQLNAINAKKSEIKDAERTEALYNLRNQVYQIKLAKAQAQQTIDSNLSMTEQELMARLNEAYSAGQNFNQTANLDPVTGLPISDGGTTQDPALIGFRRPKDEMQGSILRPRRDLTFA